MLLMLLGLGSPNKPVLTSPAKETGGSEKQGEEIHPMWPRGEEEQIKRLSDGPSPHVHSGGVLTW